MCVNFETVFNKNVAWIAVATVCFDPQFLARLSVHIRHIIGRK